MDIDGVGRVCLIFYGFTWCFVDGADVVLVVGRPRRHGDMMLDSLFLFLLIVWAGELNRSIGFGG